LVRIVSVPLVLDLNPVLNGSRAHPALYKGVPGYFTGINLAGALATDVLLVLKVVWRCTLIPPAS